MMESGVVFLDKPYGITSHHASELVKKILNAKKAGHTGTLDPKVTGLLIVLINKATRLAGLLNLDKTYVGVGKLHRDVSLKELRQKAKSFIGKIKQLPPKRSSVKRVEREREIYEFRILQKKGRYFLFRIRCQAGTYVRKLIHDFGLSFGGAHMLELRRIAIGKIKEDKAITLYQLEEKKNSAMLSIEELVRLLPYRKISLKEKHAKKFCHGAFIAVKKKIENGEKVIVMHGARVIGVGVGIDGKIKPDVVLC
jgi:H/ACA ribonucleoprotein complex subunit 4